MLKRMLAVTMIFAVTLCLTLRAEAVREIGDGEGHPEKIEEQITPRQDGDQWLIYWYVCGTDIETGTPNLLNTSRANEGNVTNCIREVENADLSSGKVKILMQAGGTSKWQHEKFKPNNGKVGRYLYDRSHDWKPLAKLVPISKDLKTQMSSREGLQDFLEFGKKLERELYPDGKFRRVFIFVDHGGGSLGGVCQDEYTAGAKIGLRDIHDAFEKVWGSSTSKPPFELVAFDTCVMSTYETATALKGTARYMVASEESIVSKVMFNYTDCLSKLSTEATMSGAQLGHVICDGYWQDCLNVAERDKKNEERILATNPTLIATMSVIDLSRMPALESAYENFGNAANEYASERSDALSAFSGATRSTEKYDCSMLDLQDFATIVSKSSRFKSQRLKDAGDVLIRAIDGNRGGAVIYNKIRGRNRNRGGGLSTYYPFTPDKGDIDKYAKLARFNLAPKSQSKFYSLVLEKATASSANTPHSNLPSDTNEPHDTNALNPLPPKGNSFDLSELADIKVTADRNKNTASVKLTQEQIDKVASVRCVLMKFTYEFTDEDLKLNWLCLGDDTAVKADWDAGTFESTFKGEWLMIEGQPVFANVVSESTIDEAGNKDGSELYSVPIELNGRDCKLLISCKYPEEEFSLVGARPDTNSDVPTGELYGIKKGDNVKPKYFDISISMKNMYTPLKEFMSKYPELNEHYLDETLSNEQREKAIKDWINALPAAEREAFTKDAFAFGEKIISGDTFRLKPYTGASFEISETMNIDNNALPDGVYVYCFEFMNPVGSDDVYTKSNAVFCIKDEEIVSTIPEEYMNELIEILTWSYYKARTELESLAEA